MQPFVAGATRKRTDEHRQRYLPAQAGPCSGRSRHTSAAAASTKLPRTAAMASHSLIAAARPGTFSPRARRARPESAPSRRPTTAAPTDRANSPPAARAIREKMSLRRLRGGQWIDQGGARWQRRLALLAAPRSQGPANCRGRTGPELFDCPKERDEAPARGGDERRRAGRDGRRHGVGEEGAAMCSIRGRS